MSKFQLSDFLKSINVDKNNVMADHPEAERDYVPFVVNRCYSYFPDTILIVNSINELCFLDSKCQYDYLFHSVRKRKRFSRWHKVAPDDVVNAMMKLYNYSRRKALETVELLTEDQKQTLLDKMETGGQTRTGGSKKA